MKLYAPKSVEAIKKKHKFRNTKSLGQNFLTDKHIVDKIIEETCIGEEDLVIEIGPGMGVLTVEAAKKARQVIAIELDKKLLPILDEVLVDVQNVQVLHGDIIKTDLSKLIQNARREDPKLDKVRIIGNLPYYITTPILMKILEEGVPAETLTVMMQREVADRIRALPGGKVYGALSVAVQYYCRVHPVASVPREVFVPMPKVDSAVLRLEVREEKPVELLEEEVFFRCIRAGFGQRRKTLRNSLTGVGGKNGREIAQLLEGVGIDPIRRAETLTMAEFAAVANAIASSPAAEPDREAVEESRR